MPCNSDHMEPSALEKELTKAYCVLDELNGLGSEPDKWKGGYHPKVYCQRISASEADALVAEACRRVRALSDEQIGECSLELQIWRRDHYLIDKERVAKDKERAIKQQLRQDGMLKLTREEKEALGL